MDLRVEEEVEVVVLVEAVDEVEVDSIEEEDVAVNKVLNTMENFSIAEEKDISSSTVDFVSKKKAKVLFQNHNIITISTKDFPATTNFFNSF